MRKRRYWFVGLLLIAAMLLTACGGNSKSSSEQTSKDVLTRVKVTGVLRVGFEGTYPPFNFLNDSKKYDGFDVDISNENCEALRG